MNDIYVYIKDSGGSVCGPVSGAQETRNKYDLDFRYICKRTHKWNNQMTTLDFIANNTRSLSIWAENNEISYNNNMNNEQTLE